MAPERRRKKKKKKTTGLSGGIAKRATAVRSWWRSDGGTPTGRNMMNIVAWALCLLGVLKPRRNQCLGMYRVSE